MSEAAHDVAAIGNAIVDVIAQAEDEFLLAQGITKGAMTLIDETRAQALYAAMAPAVEVSGGSAANTVVGLTALGGRAGFIGKVRNDQLGEVFAHDIRAAGVFFTTPAAQDGPATARSFILVTPDAQRSMNTFLGASTFLAQSDLDETLIGGARITYLEGYLFDRPEAKAAFYRAAGMAHAAGREVALTLSDPFCVDRHRAAFQHLVETEIDILFANEAELLSLYEAATFDEALQAIRGRCRLAALTRSAAGSVIVSGEEIHVVDAMRVGPVVDTTGAGDLYAAGFLFGLTRGRDLGDCGRLGSLAAAEIISHMGARPEQSLKALAEAHRLL